ncbi:MAG: SNF2-related protein, partial [Planctomycetota bacterium]
MSLVERLQAQYSPLLQDRGAHYIQDGRVKLKRADVKGIEAEVSCTRSFHVTLDLTTPELTAHCDCSYFGGAGVCKHVWAVILASEDAVTVTKPTAAKKGKREPGATKTGSELIYFLPVTTPAESTTVHVYQQSVDPKSGDPVLKPRRVRRNEVRHLPRPEDRLLLSLLFGILSQNEEGVPEDFDPSGIPYRVECSQFQLAEENCRVWLRLLAETERFFLATDDRSDVIEWHDEPWLFGVRLKPSAPGGDGAAVGFLRQGDRTIGLDDANVIVEEGAVVIDARAYPLEVGGDPAWLRKVLKGGGEAPVPDSDFDTTLCQLVESGAVPAIDLPPEWSWETDAVEPQPVLRLRLLEAGRGRRKAVRCRVYFDYGGRRVAQPDKGRSFCDPEQRRVAQRNHPAEEAAVALLQTLSVQPVAEPTAGFDLEIPSADFASVVDRLVKEGWSVESKEQRYRGAGKLRLEVKTGMDWFELDGQLELGSLIVPFPEILSAVRRGENIVRLDDGTVGILPDEWIERVRLLGNMGAEEGDVLRFSNAQGWILDALLAGRPEVSADERFVQFHERLRSFVGVEAEQEVTSFTGELRPYQRDGLGWMRFLRDFGLGGCLADDMGLGKTVQVLAVLAEQQGHTEGRPTLVVAPRSVVYNWVDEAHRFTPQLRVLEYGGAQRLQHLKDFDQYDLIVTSYGVLRRDVMELRNVSFQYVVLDEAQAIKNPSSKTAKCARLLDGKHRLALTGTPIENHIYDLWSIFEFLNPGMLGSTRSLNRLLAGGGDDAAEEGWLDLGEALRPFLLRRTKEQVATELPEKTEQTLVCQMEGRQLELYQELREHYRTTLLTRVAAEGMNATRMHVLEALLRLRQVAFHPSLVGEEFSDVASCKLDALVPQLLEVITEGHKCLVFSQFTTFLGLVRTALEKEEIVYEYLDGRTRDRQKRVERFQNDEACKVFLVSLKAGGVGLNLTAADYVYILDPWWNPAVEA